MEEAVLVISDTQIGVKSDSYSAAIAQQRMKVVANKTVKRSKNHETKITALNILLLGDLIHQDYPWFADRSEIELITIDQFRFAVDEIFSTCLIDKVLPYFKKIKVWGVPGNHGSFGKMASVKTNLDTMVADSLRTLYKNERKLSWSIEDNFYQIAEINGKRLLLFHGDQVKSYMGYPYYGIGQKVLRWHITIPGAFDVAVHGHFHTLAQWQVGSVQVFSNGTFFTGDPYSLRRVGYDGVPKQWLFFIPSDSKRSITATWPLDFL